MTLEGQDRPHHHGDLRNALIQAGISLLSEGGAEALTLRRCAARAGVSHAAPAHHFDGLPGLKAAIAQEGFGRFRGGMLSAAEAAGPSPHAHLQGICRGYFRFAMENPALFDLMFGHNAAPAAAPDKDDRSSRAYLVLREACAPFVPPGTDPRIVEAQVWSLIHGFTTLRLSGRFGPQTDPAGRLMDQVLHLLERIGSTPG